MNIVTDNRLILAIRSTSLLLYKQHVWNIDNEMYIIPGYYEHVINVLTAELFNSDNDFAPSKNECIEAIKLICNEWPDGSACICGIAYDLSNDQFSYACSDCWGKYEYINAPIVIPFRNILQHLADRIKWCLIKLYDHDITNWNDKYIFRWFELAIIKDIIK